MCNAHCALDVDQLSQPAKWEFDCRQLGIGWIYVYNMCINDFLPTLTVAAQMNGKDFEQLVVVHGNCPLHKTRIAKFCGFEFVTKRHG